MKPIKVGANGIRCPTHKVQTTMTIPTLFESKTMTNEQIIELYQRKLNMTLAELSAITGKSIKELKKILMGG